MKNDNEVSKFIAAIPIEKISQKTYSVEDAKNIYISQYRDRIFNELKVQYIQNRIRNKILKRKCNLDKDILFRKIDLDKQIDNINVSGLLSECGYEEECIDAEESNMEIEEKEEVEEESQVSFKEIKPKKNKDKSSKYLDLEAEQSGEDSEEEEEDGSDLSSIVDENQVDENTAADLYAGEKQEKDLEILKKLVKKFKKKKIEKIREIQHQRDIEDFSSEEEIFSEIPIDDVKLKKDIKVFETTYEEEIGDTGSISIKFRNLDDVDEKLNKKKKFTFGFGGN